MFIQSVPCLVVLIAHNSTELQSGMAEYSYLAFGELSRFVYRLLQKTQISSSLPVIEKRETYVLPNHSSFAPIAEEHFLEGHDWRQCSRK